MAEVNFSNAIIEPIGTVNNTRYAYANMNNAILKDVNSSGISSGQMMTTVNERKQLAYTYYGTFTASGTEFYVHSYSAGQWKISNITFNSGDTYYFVINANIVCN